MRLPRGFWDRGAKRRMVEPVRRWLSLLCPTIALQQPLALGSDAARRGYRLRHRLAPGMSRQSMTGRPTADIDECRQFLAAIEPHGPTALPPHLLRRHLGSLLPDARLQMRALLLGKCLAAGRREPAARILVTRSSSSLARRYLARGCLARRLPRTRLPCHSGLASCALLRRRLGLRCHAHIVHEIGIRAPCTACGCLRRSLLGRRQVLGLFARLLARVRTFPGRAWCPCHACQRAGCARVAPAMRSGAGTPSYGASHPAASRPMCPPGAASERRTGGHRAAAW